jgi:hypothetical protein
MKVPPQLTGAILDEFVQYRGNMLAYVASGNGTLKFDWDRIDALLQRIYLVRAGLASAAFHEVVDSELKAISLDESVRQRLWNMGGARVVASLGNVVF